MNPPIQFVAVAAAAPRALIASKITVGVDAIAMRDHFGGGEFWWETRGCGS